MPYTRFFRGDPVTASANPRVPPGLKASHEPNAAFGGPARSEHPLDALARPGTQPAPQTFVEGEATRFLGRPRHDRPEGARRPAPRLPRQGRVYRRGRAEGADPPAARDEQDAPFVTYPWGFHPTGYWEHIRKAS